jgi:hypothetical protein
MPDEEVAEITEPVEVEIVDDRIHFTLISGRRRRTYSISAHKSRNACHITLRLLDKFSERSRVLPFNKG